MKRNLLILGLIVILISIYGCGLAIKETKEEIEKMDIKSTYRLAIKYYSEGAVSESEILHKEVLTKFSNTQNPTEEDKKTYLWSLYEIAFIYYSQGNYEKAQSYLEVLFKESQPSGDKLPQVILGKKIYSNIKNLKK